MADLEGYAVVCTGDLAESKRWYANLMGREPDRTPMPEVHEWYFGKGGLQLLTSLGRAGTSRITLGVDDLEVVRASLASRGLELGPSRDREQGVRSAQLSDPDGNVIMFAQTSVAQNAKHSEKQQRYPGGEHSRRVRDSHTRLSQGQDG